MVPPNSWAMTLSGGLAVTSGNRNTSTVNVAYGVAFDPQRRNSIKSDALFIRGRVDGQPNIDRLVVNGRDEYKLLAHGFVFGQVQYTHDRFKQIDHLVAVTAGAGYRILEGPRTTLSIDAGIGGAWEKDFGVDLKTSGALTAAEKFAFALSPTATVTQSLSILTQAGALSDTLYTLGAGVTVSMTRNTQLKLEGVDVYRYRTRLPVTVRNDVTLLMSVVFRI